jgi:hypothetical protein
VSAVKKFSLRILVYYLVVALFVIGIAPPVDASFSPSQLLSGKQSDREYDLQRIQAFLEMKIVTDRLQQLGFTRGEIETRLGQLDCEQIHAIALNLDQVKVGADGLGVVIAVLVIIILVLLILRLGKVRGI